MSKGFALAIFNCGAAILCFGLGRKIAIDQRSTVSVCDTVYVQKIGADSVFTNKRTGIVTIKPGPPQSWRIDTGYVNAPPQISVDGDNNSIHVSK